MSRRYEYLKGGGSLFFKKKTGETVVTDEEMRNLTSSCGLRHIAFIMDGNGRWASRRSLPREAGHVRGASAFRNIVHLCDDFGIECVTVYAFSTENWKRPRTEIDAIMRLLDDFISEAARDNEKNNAKYRFLGDLTALDPDVYDRCRRLEKLTASNRLLLNIALNYGSRAEIVSAVNKLIAEKRTSVTEDDISCALYTSGLPDPDLIVRTAGEYRLSNFLLWQAAYSELYVTDVLWPDFGREELCRAVIAFSKRKRKYGGIIQ